MTILYKGSLVQTVRLVKRTSLLSLVGSITAAPFVVMAPKLSLAVGLGISMSGIKLGRFLYRLLTF